MKGSIEVSIICNTYNHENYIADAIESFLMQKTNFNFEILIHDDASTDGTSEIIREYEKKFPDIIKPIYQKENQYSKGVSISFTYQIPRAEGKYFALCEGDDYWTDPLKLQKQYDAMEQHPELDVCAHGHIRVDASSKKVIRKILLSKKNCIFPVEKVILGEGGFVATQSLLIRTRLFDEIPAFVEFMSYDYTWQIYASFRGGMLYLSEDMSAYRFMTPDSFTYRMNRNTKQKEAFLLKKYKMLQILDEDTNYKYHDAIQGRLLLYEINPLKKTSENKATLKRYKSGFWKLPNVDKYKVLMKCYCSVLVRLKHKLFVSKEQRIRNDIS